MSKPLTTRDILKAHKIGEDMGIWGWVHATRALEPFVPEDGLVRDLWAVMARHDADTNRNDWIGLVDDILRAQLAEAEALSKSLEADKCDLSASLVDALKMMNEAIRERAEAEARLARLRPVVRAATHDNAGWWDVQEAVRGLTAADRAWALGSEQEGSDAES